jgi:hypothetical protein
MKYIIPFFLLFLPFMASGQKPQPQINYDSIGNIIFSKQPPQITLEGVIACIGFDKESILYQKIKNLCIMWYDLEKKTGRTDEEAAIGTLNMLGELMTEMSKQ